MELPAPIRPSPPERLMLDGDVPIGAIALKFVRSPPSVGVIAPGIIVPVFVRLYPALMPRGLLMTAGDGLYGKKPPIPGATGR